MTSGWTHGVSVVFRGTMVGRTTSLPVKIIHKLIIITRILIYRNLLYVISHCTFFLGTFSKEHDCSPESDSTLVHKSNVVCQDGKLDKILVLDNLRIIEPNFGSRQFRYHSYWVWGFRHIFFHVKLSLAVVVFLVGWFALQKQ